jgi:hypothetical protein
MSESSVSAQDPPGAVPSLQQRSGQYELSDDLAKLCLPQEWKDSNRTLAWVNSICFLFLVVGLIGLRPPKVIHKALSEVVEAVPVIFTPPEEQPKAEPEAKPDEEQPQDTPTEAPQVVSIVAAADPTSVAFAVPVQGAVAVAPAAHLATPPPPANQPPPRAVSLIPTWVTAAVIRHLFTLPRLNAITTKEPLWSRSPWKLPGRLARSGFSRAQASAFWMTRQSRS